MRRISIFGFGLDFERFKYDNSKPAQREFDALFDPHKGYLSYFELLDDIPNAIPILIPTRSVDVLLEEIDNADKLNKGLIIHQRRNAEIPLSDMIVSLPPLPNDTVIVVDAGWSRDYNSLEAWTIPVLTRIHRAIPEAEIVIASSSFPDSFTHIIGNCEEDASERRLFAACQQRFNQADLTYGDWGSTRPSQGGGGGTIPSRIDIPKINSWEVFRSNPDDDKGFAEISWDAQHHPCFKPTPDCWGKQTIAITDDQGMGITGIKAATEVRINIHMTVQSGASSIIPLDETPYED